MPINNIKFSKAYVEDVDVDLYLSFHIDRVMVYKIDILLDHNLIYENSDIGNNTLTLSLNVDSLEYGNNIISIVAYDSSDSIIYANDFSLHKENRESFTINRILRNCESYISYGDVKHIPDKGYGLDGFGVGYVDIPINTDGKSNIKLIEIKDIPYNVRLVRILIDMEMIEYIDGTAEAIFSKYIDLYDYSKINRIIEI